MTGVEIAFAPLLPWPLAAALLLLAAATGAGLLLARARGAGWRVLALLAFATVLLDPVLVEERREPRKDVAAVVVDESPSQSIGRRKARAEAALAHLEEEIGRFDDLEIRVVRAGAPGGAAARDGTHLFRALGEALADVPRRRVAGAVLITDGQIHDVPAARGRLPLDAPLHALITGERGERDRRLVIEQVPRFGLVGQELEITLRVEDDGETGGAARLTLRSGEAEGSAEVPVGTSARILLPIEHAGENLFELVVEPGPHELTLENNRAVLAVNGVRDRLRVLLVSGAPYPGERTWRNLLKSDPSVDLVHFTILRPPEKLDLTPVRELSLISFPIKELFEDKLREFDLVIFDNYHRRGLLPPEYYDNIVSFVREGGAVLEVAGPDFASEWSLYQTPLAALLPGAPTGRILERGFRPELTALGRRHPVTADLAPAAAGGPAWGRWFRLVDAEPRAGEVLMAGEGGRPLLILQRFGSGRVAQMLSDQIWLWARGFEDGGPHAELVRRLAHWLMKEPELEENALTARVRGDQLEIVRRSLQPSERPVTLTTPSGATRDVALGPDEQGRASARIPVSEPGLYRLADGERRALAVVGSLRPIEWADVRATDAALADVVEARGGGIVWLADGALPDVRRVRRERPAAGRGATAPWIGLLADRDYVVTGVREAPLLPAALLLVAALAALALAWRREGM